MAKTLIIGSGHIGSAIYNRLEQIRTNEEVFIVEDLKSIREQDEAIQYKRQPYELLQESYGNKYKRTLSNNIDIISEYELIKQKKSKLSKWERDEIVRIISLTTNK